MFRSDDRSWLLNGVRHSVIEATCDLFIGELAVDALIKSSTDEWYDLQIWKLPCRDAIRYSELSHMEVEQSPSEEDPVLVNVGCDGYAAMRLEHRIEAISGDVQSVAIHLNFVGEEWDLLPGMHPKSLSLSGLIIAECDCPPGETEIEMGCSIPTRFANFYLSRFAIPELPTNPTRREMNRILGSPIAQAHNAGTVHPDLGFVIPDWAIHNHNGIGLRCSYADELLTNISVVNPDNWLGDNSHVC